MLLKQKFEIEKTELLWMLKQSISERWYDVYTASQIELLIQAIEKSAVLSEPSNDKLINGKEFKQKLKTNISKHKEERREKYIEYLSSEKWKRFRKQIIQERDGACENCRSSENLQVHHKHYINIFNEQREDVLLLCRKCHKRVHSMKPKNRKKFLSAIENKKSVSL